MKYIFDLDGVLIDARKANLEAYRSVGIEPPHDFYHRTWEEWCPVDKYKARLEALPQFAHLIRLLPLFETCMLNQHNSIILSACSDTTLQIIKNTVGLAGAVIINKLRTDSRMEILLKNQFGIPYPGIYYDDNEAFCKLVAKETRWQVCQVYL